MDKHGAREECEDDGEERDGHGGWKEISNTTINNNSLMTKTTTTSHNHIDHCIDSIMGITISHRLINITEGPDHHNYCVPSQTMTTLT